MSIEALKEQARRHEQKEEWQKALDQYMKAIDKLAADDQPDIGLYNRVGDLFVRVGNLDAATKHYEQAVDLYVEAYLPNNAIAVCKKVIRNVPERHQIYLKMGQIRAEQGFLPDARTNFLTYAERMQQAGDLDESFRALVEFCDLAPDDVDVRLAVAEQMASHERVEEAVEQFRVAYRTLMASGDSGRAAEVEAKVREIDPEASLEAAAPMAEPEEMVVTGSSLADDGEIVGDFGEISFGGEDEAEAEEPEAEVAMEAAMEEESGGFDISLGDETEEEEEEAVDLPMMSFDDDGEDDEAQAGVDAEIPSMEIETTALDDDYEDDEEDEAVDLPMMSFDDDEDGEEEATDLPMMTFDDDDEGEDTEGEAFGAEAFGEADHGERETQEYVTGEEEMEEVDLGLSDLSTEPPEEAVEAAVEEAVGDAGAAPEEPEAAPEPEEEAPADQGYVDLGSMILGGDAPEKSTRMKVAYEEPSGDEEADFAKMLTQFKEKVSENLDADDVRAHYDLGTAYKEMGLLDEAVAQFQQALRASGDHLPTYEMLGQTFMEMGQADAAARSLERALEARFEVEDELVGIYYHLARAYEELGRRDKAVEFYDRVFSLDINFADVTERLRALR